MSSIIGYTVDGDGCLYCLECGREMKLCGHKVIPVTDISPWKTATDASRDSSAKDLMPECEGCDFVFEE